MDNNYLNKVTVVVILAILTVLSFFMVRPILMSIILGFILVFIFAPVYDWVLKKVKSKNLSASILTTALIIIIIIPLIFLTPMMVNEALGLFNSAQGMDISSFIKSLLPSLSSSTFSTQADSVIHSFVTRITSGALNSVSNFIVNIPNLLLQLTVTLFTFFFVIRDKGEFIEYVKSVMPFPKDLKERLLKASRDVTASVLYGQVIIGLVQGVVAGVGFFLFGVSNAFLFTVLAIAAGILPIIGPAIVWIPVAIYLLISGNTFAAIGVTIFGIASITIDNFLRPIIVSRRIMMNSLLVLLGMVGGILLFGVLGFILGPLIIAYLIIFLELYRNRKFSGLIISEENLKK